MDNKAKPDLEVLLPMIIDMRDGLVTISCALRDLLFELESNQKTAADKLTVDLIERATNSNQK